MDVQGGGGASGRGRGERPGETSMEGARQEGESPTTRALELLTSLSYSVISSSSSVGKAGVCGGDERGSGGTSDPVDERMEPECWRTKNVFEEAG